ncbi:hypothetical protein QR680_006768 [Steinernema hermaphroditum]|uniref:Uncharacterized protein n=1 Tax=Steinernema hermaphroditum TaxID=289476 RepID=A0AA39HWE9_9BILA|nr:hypothetical protein QR680_006768 [Steinernema hermaphroditum]
MSIDSRSRVVWILIIGEAIRASCHTSIGSLLTGFLVDEFGYSEENASSIISAYSASLFITAIPGAFLGDTYLGRYKTMYIVSVLIVCSQALLVIGTTSLENAVNYVRPIIFFIGLFANTVVYGFNRVNTFAFTAEQYRPDQKKEHDNAITYLFVMVNVGATFSMIGAPILRNVIGCLGKPTCYALPWSVMFVAVVISLLLFMFCLGAVNKKQVREENSMVRVYKCLRGAINSDENAVEETKEEYLAKNPGSIDLKDYEDDDKVGPLGMWLDNSYPRFSRRFIFDVRQVGRLTLVFIPLTIFWSCWYQQISSWSLQGRYMDGRTGPLVLSADILYGSNPVLCVIFVLLLSFVIYPCLEKFMNLTALRKIAVGIALTAIAFLLASIVWGVIYATADIPSSQKAFVYDFTNCSLTSSVNKAPLNYSVREEHSFAKHVYTPSTCGINSTLDVDLKKQTGWVFVKNRSGNGFSSTGFLHESQNTVVSFLEMHTSKNNLPAKPVESTLYLHYFDDGEKVPRIDKGDANKNIFKYQSKFVSPEHFTVRVSASRYGCATVDASDCRKIKEAGSQNEASNLAIRDRLGGVYAILFYSTGEDTMEFEVVELVPPAKVSVWYQMPQYTVMALAECTVSHTALQFAFSQASPSMKSVINGIFLLTGLFGNIINIGVLNIKMAESSLSHMIKSLIYTILLIVDFFLFVWAATGYVYVYDQANPAAAVSLKSNKDPETGKMDVSMTDVSPIPSSQLSANAQ